MMSPERIAALRRMTLGERLKLVLRMMSEFTPDLLRGSPEIVHRRFELLRRENDERTRRICEGLARAEGRR